MPRHGAIWKLRNQSKVVDALGPTGNSGSYRNRGQQAVVERRIYRLLWMRANQQTLDCINTCRSPNRCRYIAPRIASGARSGPRLVTDCQRIVLTARFGQHSVRIDPASDISMKYDGLLCPI